jgi:hypothetical protein
MVFSFLLVSGVWVESLLLAGLLAAIGALAYWRGLYGRFRSGFRRRPRRAARDPYQGDAEDFERLLRF